MPQKVEALSAHADERNDCMLHENQQRWSAISEPDAEINQAAFRSYIAEGPKRRALNCAVTPSRARQLTDFKMPEGWSAHLCLVASGKGRFPPGLDHWRYQPHIRAEAQLPQLRPLPANSTDLSRLPWFASHSQCTGARLNARLLRYHHDLWHDLKPKVLRGVHTTLVYVTPQLGFALTPHIQLQKAFQYFASLSRACGPIQLFPARYIYPDASLGSLADAPCPIFSDLLPNTGGASFPVMEATPDPWGVLAHFDQNETHYGYPFSGVTNPYKDFTVTNAFGSAMLLPDGRRVRARHCESRIHATLDDKLVAQLRMDRDAFIRARCLTRGTATHDGLPFQLPGELQCMVYAVILTHWEMTLDKPGNLDNYTLTTQHAAIRGFNYYQRVEPYYSNFVRLIAQLSRDSDFKTYPLSTHLTHNWLGGNLQISNHASASEHEIGADLMRNYYLQQLDWLAGVVNLWNHPSFRTIEKLEDTLASDGLAFHQMRRMLRLDSYLFKRPAQKPSPWPDLHPGWTELDRTGQVNRLPRI
jgi:hypothetical protein